MKRAAKQSDEELVNNLLRRGLVYLNAALTDLTRREVAVLLWHEVHHEKRWDFIRRLHQRLGKLRSKDEFKELCKTKHPSDVAVAWLEKEVHRTEISNTKD